MTIHKVGHSEISNEELAGVAHDAEWVVYAYQQGAWEGSGWAVWKSLAGEFFIKNLSHCSCYGPCEPHREIQKKTAAEVSHWLTFDPDMKNRKRAEGDFDWDFINPIREKLKEFGFDGVSP